MDHNATDAFSAEVRSRFGVLPNFFCTAASAPGLIQQLRGFAKAGYLDNPALLVQGAPVRSFVAVLRDPLLHRSSRRLPRR
jgi:hypothetical protein